MTPHLRLPSWLLEDLLPGEKHWMIYWDLGFQNPGGPLSPVGNERFIWGDVIQRDWSRGDCKVGLKMCLTAMHGKASSPEERQRGQL